MPAMLDAQRLHAAHTLCRVSVLALPLLVISGEWGMSRSPVPVVSDSDRKVLESWVRSTSVPAGLARRARIVLLASEGVGTNEIVDKVGSTRPTVIGWRNRYMTEGLAGLDDRPKKGREPEIDQIEVINATLQPPPEQLGVTHWSSRILGKQLGISNVTVAKIWKRWGIKPWRQETFKFSTDPELEAKIRDVVGLYLDPPEKAVVLSIDEKSQIQALDRTPPILPMRPDLPERWTHDYVRHGTTTLFAALEVATGRVTQTCLPRHRSDESLRFLKQVAKAYPRVELHVVCDNYATNLFKCQQEIGSAAMIFQAPTGFAPTPPVASPG